MGIFNDEAKYTIALRCATIDRLCIPMLEQVKLSFLRDFYVKHVKSFMTILESKFSKFPEAAFDTQLQIKICSFRIMSCLFLLMPKSELISATSAIVRAYIEQPTTGKELCQGLTKVARGACTEDMRGETALLETRRRYHCAAYNCLVSVISSTQTDLKFYKGFLFAENIQKGQFLFDNFVDKDKKYEFMTELEVPFERKRKLKLIRKSAQPLADGSAGQDAGKGRYLSSQYLMETSLSQDLGQFDFNSPAEAYAPAKLTERRLSDEKNEVEKVVLEHIELDELNKHECMDTLLTLLKHMKDTGVYTVSDDVNEMPTWMTCLHTKMTASDTHINIKLFIAKVIVNVPLLFQPFGKFWIPSLVEMVVRSEIPGEPLNYFVNDIIVVVLSWSEVVIPEDTMVGRHLASSLFDFIVKYCYHKNSAVLKNNLHLVKTLTQVWKDRLEINYKLIYDHFSNTDKNTKNNVTGIQLLGIIIENGFQPFKSQSGLTENSFYQMLSDNLDFKYQAVYEAAAEVCGAALKCFKDHGHNNCGLFEMVNERLLDYSRSLKDRFVTCIYKIHLNYPSIVEK